MEKDAKRTAKATQDLLMAKKLLPLQYADILISVAFHTRREQKCVLGLFLTRAAHGMPAVSMQKQ